MAKPTDTIVFAGDTNYPAGAEPEQGTAQKVDPARETTGYRPDEKPKAQEHNWLFNLIGLWIAWLDEVNLRTITKTFTPTLVTDNEGSWDAFSSGFIQSTAGGLSGYLACDFLEEGDRIQTIDFRVMGDGAADATFSLNIIDEDGDVVSGSGFPAGSTDTNRSATPAWLNMFTGTRVLAANERLEMHVTPNAAAYRISAIKITYSRPSL